MKLRCHVSVCIAPRSAVEEASQTCRNGKSQVKADTPYDPVLTSIGIPKEGVRKHAITKYTFSGTQSISFQHIFQ
jgi:hypothetical protein